MLGEYSSTWVLRFALCGYFVLEVLTATTRVCRTTGCKQIAEIFKKNMDPSVNPCDDFYHFACGNYVKSEKIPEDETQVSTLTKVNDIMVKQVRGLLENAPPHHNEPRAFKMARDLYNICLREDLAENRGTRFVVDMMKSVGGWPAMEGDRWDSDRFNWVQMVYRLHDLGFMTALFELTVRKDFVNRKKNILVVDQVQFGLDREYLIQGQSNMLVKAYRDYMVDMAHLFGLKREVAAKEIGDVLDFEMRLANISLSNEDRQVNLRAYRTYKVNMFRRTFPIVDWVDYINKIMRNNFRGGDKITVAAPIYLHGLFTLLPRTDKRTLANYLIWKALYSTVGMLTSEMRDRILSYDKFLIGKMKYQSHWKECLALVSGSMDLAVSAMYVRNYFKPEAKETAIEIVENIRLEMVNLLMAVDWMDRNTRYKAIEKARLIDKHIGYPNELLDDKKIEKHYEKLEITGELYLESILNLTRFLWDHSATMLGEIVNQTDWRTHGNEITIMAYYNPLENSMQFPAGLLQNVFFSHDRPKYMNYGAIGSLIGHETTHGFDFLGKDYGRYGDFQRWYQPNTIDALINKLKCFVKQANNYTVKSVSMNLKGVNIQGEIGADTGGIKLSYRAYNTWATQHQEEPALVGFEKSTPQQMFWLSAANVWCTAYREESLRLEISTAYHPPAEYRVNGPMRNLEAFARDFQCPVGSNMNPAQKCYLW